MSIKIFLHGGWDQADSRAATFGRFVAEVLHQPADKLALVIAEAEDTTVSPKKLALLNGRPPFRISPYLLA
ncbi:MAG: hypothetical protein KC449_24900 [Anaerolineales bacterium]|nr:hypothetical protein [Anaerolineales bacterium]